MTGRIATQILSCTSRNFPGLNHFEGLCQNPQRVLQINELRFITKEVVETARELLIIGST
jgi:hypothetical protein